MDPAGGGFTALACPSTDLCVAVDATGNAFVSTDLMSRVATWTVEAIDPGNRLSGIACPSASLCVATDSNESVVTSTDPAGGAGAWSRAVVDTWYSQSCGKYDQFPCPTALIGVSCPSTGLCVAMDFIGGTLTSTDPAGGAAAWTRKQIDSAAYYSGGMVGFSCPSIALCVAASNVSEDGQIDVTGAPTRSASDWTAYPVPFSPYWISCPLASLCVSDGGAVSTDPMAGPASWRTSDIDPQSLLSGIACASPLECVAVDIAGQAVIGTPAVLPIRTGALPRITGEARVGETLRTTTGGWVGTDPIRYDDQWQRCDPRCVPITNATSTMYRVTREDRYARIRAQVTASDPAGTSRPVVSARTRLVAAAFPKSAQIRRVLRALLVPRGARAQIRALLLLGSYPVSFAAPAAGHLSVSWRSATRPHWQLGGLARNITSARTVEAPLTLTRRGRATLQTAAQLRVTVSASYAITGRPKVTVSQTVTLRR